MALSKKAKNKILSLPIYVEDDNQNMVYSDENEQIVLKALEDFEDNEQTVVARLGKNEKKLFRLETLSENNKKVGKKLETKILKLKETVESDKSLMRNWITPTLNELNEKYLDFIEQKYSDEIDEYIKQIEEE